MPRFCEHGFTHSQAFVNYAVTCQDPIPIYVREKIPFLNAAVLWTWVHSLSSLCQLRCDVKEPDSLHIRKSEMLFLGS
jgi:hypothetical protein